MIGDVDFVVTWVDGSDPRHEEKRLRFAPPTSSQPHAADAIAPIRWQDNNEIGYLLRSVEKFAPWVRKIWIVTDSQRPQLDISETLLSKIRFVDHTEIFEGYEDYLPTFNSISIASMLWRINGLAENYVYFNDDIFLTNAASKSDFFTENGIMLRGKITGSMRTKLLSDVHQTNAMGLLSKSKGLRNAHVAIASKKSLLADFFEARPQVLRDNISHRFRHHSQFSAFALSSCIASEKGIAYRKIYKDFSHVSAHIAQNGTAADLTRSLANVDRPHVLLACINDAATIASKGIDLADYMQNRILTRKGRRGAIAGYLRHLPKFKVPIS